MMNAIDKQLVHELVSMSLMLFHLDKAAVESSAKTYVQHNTYLRHDPLILHGKIRPAAINMLLQYHLITLKQLDIKIQKAIH